MLRSQPLVLRPAMTSQRFLVVLHGLVLGCVAASWWRAQAAGADVVRRRKMRVLVLRLPRPSWWTQADAHGQAGGAATEQADASWGC